MGKLCLKNGAITLAGLVLLLLVSYLFYPNPAYAQFDGLFTQNNNTFTTYDNDSNPDDGIIHWDEISGTINPAYGGLEAGYSRNFGSNATVRIRHLIIMNGYSGQKGADGQIYVGDPPLPPGYTNANGEEGTDGHNGFTFNISAGTCNFDTWPYANLFGGYNYYSGISSNGGSAGAGGHGGGFVLIGEDCDDWNVTRGTPGTPGIAGRGGNITINVDLVYFLLECDSWGHWQKPSISSNGGNGAMPGNPEYFAGVHISLAPVGYTGHSGSNGGNGGTISFGQAEIYMCPQDDDLFAVDCPPGSCRQSAQEPCNDIYDDEELALGYMRLPISAHAGNGGNGGTGGPAFDEFQCGPFPECYGKGGKGGDAGDGGNGGSLSSCASHPLLFSAKGGNGGNGGNGGISWDPLCYEYSSDGGDGGDGGNGGLKGEGCGVLSEATGGSGGLGGNGHFTGGWNECEDGEDGADGDDNDDPITIDKSDPIDACGLSIYQMESGYNVYKLGNPYSGSWARGDNLITPWNEETLQLYLKGDGYNQRIYIETVTEYDCYDKIKFWINRDGSGTYIDFPDPGVYDLFVSNGTCQYLFENAITVQECSPGESCACPFIADCDEVYVKNDFPGVTNDHVGCISGTGIIGHWLKVTIPAKTEITVEIDGLQGSQGGIGFYSGCISLVKQTCGYNPTLSYENTQESPVTGYALVNYHQCESPVFTITCEDLCDPGESCSCPEPVTEDVLYNPQNPIPGAGDDKLDCMDDSGYPSEPILGKWLSIQIPPNQKVTVYVRELDLGFYTGVGLYEECADFPNLPISDPECDWNDVSQVYENSSGVTKTIKALANHHQYTNYWEIEVEYGTILAQDECEGAILLYPMETFINIQPAMSQATFSQGFGSLPGCASPPANPVDIWYEAPGSAFVIVMENPSANTGFVVYEECDYQSIIGCSSDDGGYQLLFLDYGPYEDPVKIRVYGTTSSTGSIAYFY